MPKAINIQRYLDAFHPDHTLATYTLGDDMPAKQATGPGIVHKTSKHVASPSSIGKLAGSPDKGKRKPKVKRSTLQREQTMQAKSRDNAGFTRGKQAAIATLPNGEQIVLMLPAKRRRGSKYVGGLS